MGPDPKGRADVAGHTSLRVTQRYIDADQDAQRKIVQLIRLQHRWFEVPILLGLTYKRKRLADACYCVHSGLKLDIVSGQKRVERDCKAAKVTHLVPSIDIVAHVGRSVKGQYPT